MSLSVKEARCEEASLHNNLLPGEQILCQYEQPRGWYWWRRWFGDIFDRALPLFFLVTVPLLLCCVPLAPELLGFWLLVAFGLMVGCVVRYVRHRMQEYATLTLTSLRVIVRARESGMTMVWSYPLPQLQAWAESDVVYLRNDRTGAARKFRGVQDAEALLARIRRAQAEYTPVPRPEPLAETHPLLPPGALLYGAGDEYPNRPSIGEWVLVWSLMGFCVSVAADAWVFAHGGNVIGWIAWALLVLLVIYFVRALHQRKHARPGSYIICSSGVYLPGDKWAPCSLANCYPEMKIENRDGSVTLLFALPVDKESILPGLNVENARETEALLMALYSPEIAEAAAK